jgi:neurotransmitter:Na+ symporter, NSS family
MPHTRKSIHGHWSSRWAFILAATGSAVGLGNVWKFPYITGRNGGGAFVLIYLLCVALIGIPIMIAEIMLGRRGRQNPINTMRTLAEESGQSTLWGLLGWLGIASGSLILSYYSVIAGWTLAYVFRTAAGIFTDATAEGVTSIFGQFVGNPEGVLAWHTIFMVMTMVVVSRGVRSGLEQAVKFLMPALFVILLVLCGYAMNTRTFMQGVHFLFTPNFGAITPTGILTAMGQAFFSLSLGMGAIMIYGSYLPHSTSIARSSVVIAVADTVVALLAGVAIFPVVFANGLAADQGPGLIFRTLPLAFGHMPWGSFFGTLFFVLLVVAAWTSAISLVEPIVTFLVEIRGMTRVKAAVWSGTAIWALGIGTVLSFSRWSDWTVLGKTFFDLLDFLTSNIMLPVGGLLIAIFAGWMMKQEASRDELAVRETAYALWRFVIRYITPVGVLLILLHATGALTKLLGL